MKVAFLGVGLVCAIVFAGCVSGKPNTAIVSKWDRFEQEFESVKEYAHPLQDVSLQVSFNSPSGEKLSVDGFWDGGKLWKVRFAPNVVGKWSYTTICSDRSNPGLHGRSGSFICTAASGKTIFSQHGPVKLSRDRFSLIHDDHTPFFWLSDTAWSGPLLSDDAEWLYYLEERGRQKFTTVQFVATQYRAAPKGDRDGQLAYSGREQITLNPKFFQRMDGKLDSLNANGLLAAPVLLWANPGRETPEANPGFALPEDQAILLARYMIARWQGNNVAWILFGDGNYQKEKAEKWIRMGRAVFGDRPHAPTMLHPGGQQWNLPEFANEKWLDIIGYQSGHGDDDSTLRWIFEGPPAKDWKLQPHRPFINLEPPYENHIAYQSKERISDLTTRRSIYWSLLASPTAGVSYGGHGVWGWDDGTQPPVDHPSTGVPLPWQQALKMPGAEQMAYLHDLFAGIDFWRLRPYPEMLTAQAPAAAAKRHIAAARTPEGDLALIYVPEDRSVSVSVDKLPKPFDGEWFNPRTGERSPVVAVINDGSVEFSTPDPGDFVLVLKKAK